MISKKTITIKDTDIVRVKYMGDITEVMYQTANPSGGGVIKIDRDHYMIKSTGEICEYNHQSSRQDNMDGVRRSLQRLRDYINYNVTDVSKVRWLTLTYAENMRDSQRLYKDFKSFIRKVRNFYKTPVEYICACEPQGRGAWHMHAMFIFPDTAPFMENQKVAELWGQGFVKVKALRDIDNIGVYLTAYMTDIEMDLESMNLQPNPDAVIVTTKQDKRYIKGGRLCMYPNGFNLYRTSSQIRKPLVEHSTYKKVKEKVTDTTLTYEKSFAYKDITGFENSIRYEYYNAKRGKNKDDI